MHASVNSDVDESCKCISRLTPVTHITACMCITLPMRCSLTPFYTGVHRWAMTSRGCDTGEHKCTSPCRRTPACTGVPHERIWGMGARTCRGWHSGDAYVRVVRDIRLAQFMPLTGSRAAGPRGPLEPGTSAGQLVPCPLPAAWYTRDFPALFRQRPRKHHIDEQRERGKRRRGQ